MKGLARFVANAVAVFLALYLVDSVAEGRFVVKGVWAAIILALVLGFLNSLIRPLHRARSKPLYAGISALATLLVNALVLQLLVWARALSTADMGWVFLAAAFVAVVTGAISWLIGFGSWEKTRATAARGSTTADRAVRRDPRRELPRSGRERLH